MMDLAAFQNNNLFEAGTEFFNRLGIRLNSNTAASLGAKDLLKEQYKDKDIFEAIKETYFLGLVDDSIFGRNVSLLSEDKISLKEADEKINPDYNGLMVFAVKLPDSFSPTRGGIADLTRAFNRVSKNIPVVLLLKYGNLLSFATSERTKYKQAWREGEKIGKISLLKDINIDSPHTGHLKILHDLKVKPDVTDFNALYKQWQEVFDVQLLNKKFYQELFYWYLWAVKEVKFPQMRPNEDLIPDDAHQSESVIRLLTRLLFCWFMKEKQKLIPELLFDKNEIRKILTGFSPENGKSSVFYMAILQNLFFATLSVPINKRKYIREAFKGVNKDYGNQYVYRYQNEFVDAKENLKLFKDIPFLNGGLFECLDEKPENDNEKEIRLDGFSTIKKKQAFVPDHIFWDEHRGIDLSRELDKPKKKNETVHGIIDILNSYKFTIEENTPLEEEIALDPELLGKVFESLLAYYNPETKANARKQTGSFYTPREIVNYMVDESLIAYLSNALERHSREGGNPETVETNQNVKELYARLRTSGMTENKKQDNEARLRDLISYSKTDNPFTEKETGLLIQALENLKVLDPACGSGAFPMGILHKLVWVLQKVDPENKRWFESIIKRLPDYAQAEMRKKLEGENWDYLRKLGIIQQSVYGVDIQPIAIQIAKLRFFISLLVDQDIKGKRENNFGLQPLPNLDFKLVSANTLIGAPEQSQQNEGGLLVTQQDEFFDKFNTLTGQYFGTYDPAEKKKLTKKIEKLVGSKVQEKVDQIQSLSTHTDKRFSKHVAEKNKALIGQKKNDAKLWESYNNLFKHESVGFFETKYFFPEVKEGFDVVIGNPPYVDSETMTKSMPELRKKISMSYSAAKGNWDLYIPFWELGFKLLLDKGNAVFITPNKWLSIKYGEKLRGFLHAFVNRVGNCDLIDVFEAGNSPVIVFINKAEMENEIHIDVFNSDYIIQETVETKNSILNYGNWGILLSTNVKLLLKISHCKKRVKDDYFAENPFTVSEAYEVTDFLEDLGEIVLFNPKKYFRFVNTGTIDKYLFLWGRKYTTYIKKKYLLPVIKRASFLENFPTRYKQMDSTKIIISGMRHFECMLDDEANIIAGKSTVILKNKRKSNLKEILGILNSKLISFYIKESYGALGIDGGINFTADLVENLPLPDPDKLNVQNIENVVDQILLAKQKNPTADTTELENKIDVMVYKLYDLTYEEVKIIDPEFEMTEKDYDTFALPEED